MSDQPDLTPRFLTPRFWPNPEDPNVSYLDIFSIKDEPSPTTNTRPIWIRACEECVLLRSRIRDNDYEPEPCNCRKAENPQGYNLDLSEIGKDGESDFKKYRDGIMAQLTANPRLLLDCYIHLLASSEDKKNRNKKNLWKNIFIEISIKIAAIGVFNQDGVQEGNIKVEGVRRLERGNYDDIKKWRGECGNQTIGFTLKFEVVYPHNQVDFQVLVELPLEEGHATFLNNPSTPYQDPCNLTWINRISLVLSDTPDSRIPDSYCD